ncbi:MAG: hypothetical protein WD471_01165 [Candidatus Paceibacterota bacterium]
MKKYFLMTLSFLVLFPKVASAHCPLCTVGAGALAVLAASLGVSSIVVGILIGAFAVALGIWISNLVKKQFVPYQKKILTVLIFLGTVVPIMPLVQDYAPLFISFIGDYGKTFAVNLYLFGVVIGAIVMAISPFISRFVTKVRKKQVSFQGITITMFLLILTSVLVQIFS